MVGDEDNVKATLLYYLRKKRIMGGVHIPFDKIGKGFPVHLKGDVKKAAKELVKKGFLMTKPTSYGLQVSLNKNKLKEIEDFVLDVLGIEF